MKNNLLSKVNLLLVALISMLGFNSCDFPNAYGPPIEDVDSLMVNMYGVPPQEYYDEDGTQDNELGDTENSELDQETHMVDE